MEGSKLLCDTGWAASVTRRGSTWGLLPREATCSRQGWPSSSTCICSFKCFLCQREGGGLLLIHTFSSSFWAWEGPNRAQETGPGVCLTSPCWRRLKGGAGTARQWLYCIFRQAHPQAWAHSVRKTFESQTGSFSFFRNLNLFSSHSRNTKYQGTHEAPKFYFYTHNFETSLNRFNPNLVLKKMKGCSGTATINATFQSRANFFTAELADLERGLVKTETIKNPKKKKKSYLPACWCPWVQKWREITILHN